MTDKMQLKRWRALQYRDPIKFLSELNQLRTIPGFEKLDPKLRNLRLPEHRPLAELRQAAIFCIGMGQRLGKEIWVAHQEDGDYDAVAAYRDVEGIHYTPIQLKELVPEHLNPAATLQSELTKLRKYRDSRDLAVAFMVNRLTRIVPAELDVTGIEVGEVWLYGAIDEDQVSWMLLGDILQQAWGRSDFVVPRMPPVWSTSGQ